MRLAPDTIETLPPEVSRPGYDRDAQAVGIVHFGIGAFARAHLAAYCDAAMRAGERDWMIAGVSLRSTVVAEQLNPQAGLYTLTEQDRSGAQTRIIGSVRGVLVGGRDSDRIVAAIAAPTCRIVSFTVTEKGYCRSAEGGLDVEAARASFYPLLAAGLARRKGAGLPGVTLLSCDNLSDNGSLLYALVTFWLERADPELARWFAAECRCPATMVDRILPASSPIDLARIKARLGLRDDGAVFTEPFSQWVIAEDFAALRPRWEDYGVRIVADVAPFETAKLRMLNGAHSLLAYAGLARGHVFVHEAIADPWLRALVETLLRDEAAPTVAAGAGQDLAGYADALLQRLANPALAHRLAQVAMDGSQKIPQRWLETLCEAREQCPAILTGIAAWLVHIADGSQLDDPLGQPLREAIGRGSTLAHRLRAIMGRGGLVKGRWNPSASDAAFVERTVAEMLAQQTDLNRHLGEPA